MSLPTTPLVPSAYSHAGPRRQTPNILSEESEELQSASSVRFPKVLDDQNVRQESVSSRDGNGDRDITMSDSNPSKEDKKKLEQIVQHFYVKAAHVILGSRISLPVRRRLDGTRRIDKWFQLETDDTEAFSEALKLWKYCDPFEEWPPSLIVETYLDARDFTVSHPSDHLATQGASRRSHTEIILERWEIKLKDGHILSSGEFGPPSPKIYKKCVITLRSLYVTTRLLPTWSFMRERTEALEVKCRVVEGGEYRPLPNDNSAPIPNISGDPTTTVFYLGEIDTPAGSLAIKVEYRNELKSPVDNSEPSKQSHIIEGDQTELQSEKQQNVQPDTKGTTQKSLQKERKASELSELPRPISMSGIMDVSMSDIVDFTEPMEGRRLDLWECRPCRDLHKKCFPINRVWPQKCEQCLQHQPELECSEPQMEALERHPRRDSPAKYDEYWTRGRQRGGSAHSPVSSRGSSPASLRGISLAPKEYKPSELPSLRHSYSSPDLQNTEWTGIRSRRQSATSDQSLLDLSHSPPSHDHQQIQRRQRPTKDQIATLEMEFNKNPTPTASVRERIAEDVNITERSVQIWFQTRRAKLKSLAGKSIETREDQGPQEKPRIHHFSCRSLSIGTWRRISQNAMDLAIFYTLDRAYMTYYIKEDQSGYKIEYPFAFIKNIYLETGDNETPGGLVVELNQSPIFFMETSEPGGFFQCGDFTEGQQASQTMIHHLGGSPEALSGQLARLVSLESYVTRRNTFS